MLHGPTNFAEFLGIAQSIATQYDGTGGRQFLILLIVTDGEITDMDKTVDRIVNMSALPCAIVIVGVGAADFKSMDILDADDKPLESNGKRMVADIVQFVPFRKFRNDPTALAREVLQEVPQQLVEYMKRRGVVPAVPQIRPMGTGQYAQVGGLFVCLFVCFVLFCFVFVLFLFCFCFVLFVCCLLFVFR